MTVCLREIKDIEDTLKLKKDIDRLGIWARKWGMRFQPVKCNMMQLTKKHNKIQASYTLEGIVLENVESIKYLGVTIKNLLLFFTSRLSGNNILLFFSEMYHQITPAKRQQRPPITCLPVLTAVNHQQRRSVLQVCCVF